MIANIACLAVIAGILIYGLYTSYVIIRSMRRESMTAKIETQEWIGRRVRLHPRSAPGPETGVGSGGTVVGAQDIDTTATGMRLRYTRLDIRLDQGALVSREPQEVTIVADASGRPVA